MVEDSDISIMVINLSPPFSSHESILSAVEGVESPTVDLAAAVTCLLA